MQIRTAEFVKSSNHWKDCPAGTYPEYAFIGRSNVGKSSLINLITGRKALAKTSVTPGKTRLIQHYLINRSWYLADLPGIGYAKLPKGEREHFGGLISGYLLNRKNLQMIFMLLDVRLKPQAIDTAFMRAMLDHQLPFLLVFTKSDKLTREELKRNLSHYRGRLVELLGAAPQDFITSSKTKLGRKEILDYIELSNTNLKNPENDH